MTKRLILLQALASTPEDISRLARSIEGAAADRRVKAGAWSCRDIIAHLVEVERDYHVYLSSIPSVEKPSSPAIIPGKADFDPRSSLLRLCDRFSHNRQVTLAILGSLPAGEWQRPEMHATRGHATLRFLIQDWVNHDIEHTHQLVQTVQRVRKAYAADR
jgi:hypothetical protein